MADTVAETARTLEVIAGPDERDPGSLQAAGRERYRVGGYVEAVEDPPDLDSVTLGRLTNGFGEGVTDAVEERTSHALDILADAGASVVDVTIEHYDAVAGVKNALSVTELAGHWHAGGAPVRRGGTVDEGYQVALDARMTARSNELGHNYKGKVLAGARILRAHGGRHYTRAQAARDVLAGDVDATFDDVHVLVTPTMPDVAPPVGDAQDPGFDYGRNCRLADVTRHPAISLPNGRVDGPPVGLQLMAPQVRRGRPLRCR
jgi:Asp-tRNA(Asn)/Glu-tRNA(Gln) amidotransferase A subunit family amidase